MRSSSARRRGVENLPQDVTAFGFRRPAGLCIVLNHRGQNLRADYLAVMDRVARNQRCTGLPTPHLIEEQIAQSINDYAGNFTRVPIRLHRLGHVALDAGDNIHAGRAQLAEILHLLIDRGGVVDLLMLQFHRDHIDVAA